MTPKPRAQPNEQTWTSCYQSCCHGCDDKPAYYPRHTTHLLAKPKARRLRYSLGLLLLLSSLSLAVAQGRTWQGEIEGVATWITVLNAADNSPNPADVSEDWWTWGDAERDAYIFAFENPDNVRLILRFYPQDDGWPKAHFYLNDEGREVLEYRLDDEGLEVLSHGGLPSYILMPQGGGWFVDGDTNYTLTMHRDGIAGNAEEPPDGEIDYISYIGSDAPGIPSWQINRLLNNPRPNWGYPRFGLVIRGKDSAPFNKVAPMMPQFPHFGIGQRNSNWFIENPFPFFYNLANEEFERFGFVAFQDGGSYRSHSLSYPPLVNFESPFANYGFDPSTREAQLVVRAISFPANDFLGPAPNRLTRSTFRYSWKVRGNRYWDYGLHMAGPIPYEHEMTVGDERHSETLIMPAEADALPSWVAEQLWPLVTFVEPPPEYAGSEGIYFYSAQDDTFQPWLAGDHDHAPPELLAPYMLEDNSLVVEHTRGLPPGFRGEFSAAYLRRPEMYFSPVDMRLHLLYAQGGIWNLGDGTVLRSHNLNGDPYIDAWTREPVPPVPPMAMAEDAPEDAWDDSQGASQEDDPELPLETFFPRAFPSEPQEGLYALEGFLIYKNHIADEPVVELRFADVAAELYRISPPTDRESWLAFQEQTLPDIDQGRDPFDLYSWLEPFDVPQLRIVGARLEYIRPSPEGLVMLLDIADGAVIDDSSGIDALQALSSGRFILAYDRNTQQWWLEPAQEQPLEVQVDSQPGAMFHAHQFSLRLDNPGNVDWQGAVSVYFAGQRLQHWPDFHVASYRSRQEYIRWMPTQAHHEALQLHLGDEVHELAPLNIAHVPRISLRDAIWEPFYAAYVHWFALALLLAVTSVTFWKTWSSS